MLYSFVRQVALVSIAAVICVGFTGCYKSIRKNAKDMTTQERDDFVAAILLLKETPSPFEDGISYYDQFVKWHVEINNCLGYSYHAGPAFLPWHRAFLMQFELALREVSGKDISVPYWEWNDPESTAAVFNEEFMGTSGDPNDLFALDNGPFRKGEFAVSVFMDMDPHKFPHIVRNIGSSFMPVLPTPAQIETALGVETYDVFPWNEFSPIDESFRNHIEGFRGTTNVMCMEDGMIVRQGTGETAMHNQVHNYVGGAWVENSIQYGGTMLLHSSPADPIFWLHHAYVDKLWEEWMQRHGKRYAPFFGGREHHNAVDVLWPFTKEIVGKNVRAIDVIDLKKTGVQYAE
ncbi:MAG: tyrosinase [Candidatus Hydrogenedentota bacterium]